VLRGWRDSRYFPKKINEKEINNPYNGDEKALKGGKALKRGKKKE